MILDIRVRLDNGLCVLQLLEDSQDYLIDTYYSKKTTWRDAKDTDLIEVGKFLNNTHQFHSIAPPKNSEF